MCACICISIASRDLHAEIVTTTNLSSSQMAASLTTNCRFSHNVFQVANHTYALSFKLFSVARIFISGTVKLGDPEF